jgi:hypothetical protein
MTHLILSTINGHSWHKVSIRSASSLGLSFCSDIIVEYLMAHLEQRWGFIANGWGTSPKMLYTSYDYHLKLPIM